MFSRAYDLAEELCANCKAVIKSKKVDASMIDWHVLQGENTKSIQEIRRTQYDVDGLSLTMRPLYLNKDEFNSFKNFKWALNHIQIDENKEKHISRSKIKALRGEYVKGERAAKVYIDYYKLNDFFNWFHKEKCSHGILNSTAVFFDSIEIMDLVKEV